MTGENPPLLPRILLVDDEKIIIATLINLLGDRYRLSVAKNGQQALSLLHPGNLPDLILLDILMPDMDGYETCRRLKANPLSREIPVIFITCMSDEEDEARGFEVGAVDFIAKPIVPSILLARIGTQIMLEQQKQRLLALNEMKNHFLGMAAHDLRNPINVIHGLSDMLLTNEVSTEETHDYLEIIRRVSSQMFTLIDDLLDVSAIESGHLQLNLQPLDLTTLTAERLKFFYPTALQKNIRISLTLRDVPKINADESKLAQVLDNLISNALKYSPTDTEIFIYVGQKAGRVVFEIQDQGLGFSPGDKEKLFHPIVAEIC